MVDDYDFVKCSECGTEFYIPNRNNYMYKDKNKGYACYQCCYTCYDHSRLRSESPYKYENYRDLVKKCEDTMRSKGKTVLEPILDSDRYKRYYNTKGY